MALIYAQILSAALVEAFLFFPGSLSGTLGRPAPSQ
jgi:hypothetical protein